MNSNLFVGETNLRGIVKFGGPVMPETRERERRIEDQREGGVPIGT